MVALRNWLIASRPRMLLAAIPLSTGAALIVHIVASASLALAVIGVLVFALAVTILVWRRLAPARRVDVQRRVIVGVAAGLLGTFAYDLSRLALVSLVPMSFSPFGALPLFGQALIGGSDTSPAAVAVGTLYHLMNGIGFGTAFVIVVPRPNVWLGIAWAAVLEALMVSLYPGWLNLKALDEFLSVSIVGHVAYGSTLGAVSAWAFRRFHITAEPAQPGRS